MPNLNTMAYDNGLALSFVYLMLIVDDLREYETEECWNSGVVFW